MLHASDWPRTFFTPKVFLFSIDYTPITILVMAASYLARFQRDFPNSNGMYKCLPFELRATYLTYEMYKCMHITTYYVVLGINIYFI